MAKQLPLLALVLALFAPLAGHCAESKNDPTGLIGVWKLVSDRDLTTGKEEDPGNTHYVITAGYIMTIGGAVNRPKIEKNFMYMTDTELRSQLPMGGGFMSYQIVDGKIHRTTIFAMSAIFEGKTIETEFTVTHDTLVFRDHHYADGHMREWHFVRIE